MVGNLCSCRLTLFATWLHCKIMRNNLTLKQKWQKNPLSRSLAARQQRQRGCNAISRQIMRRLRVQMLQLLLLQLLLLLLVPLAVLLLLALLLLFCALLLFQPKVLLSALKLRNKLPLLLACSPPSTLCPSLPLSFALSFIAISLWLPAPTIRRQPQWPQLLGNLSYAYLAALAIPITSSSFLFFSSSSFFYCSFCSALFAEALFNFTPRFGFTQLPLLRLNCSLDFPFLSFALLCFAQLFVRAARHFLPHCK